MPMVLGKPMTKNNDFLVQFLSVHDSLSELSKLVQFKLPYTRV